MQSQAGRLNARVEPVQNASGGAISAIGGGMQRLGQAVTAAADQYQDNIDVAQSLRMRNLYTAEVESAMQDPQGGFLTTVGAGANKESRERSFKRITEQRKKIEALGQNEIQRLNFTSYADRQDMQARQRADIHQEREAKTFLAGETSTAAQQGLQRSITLVGTEEGDIAFAEAMKGVNKLADIYGFPADSAQRMAMVQGALDKKHSGSIEMLTQDPSGALEAAGYLAKHRNEMSPGVLSKSIDDVRRAMSVVQKGAIAAQSTSLAMDIAESTRPTYRTSGPVVMEMRGEIDIDALVPTARKRLDAMFQAGEVSAEVRDATLQRVAADYESRSKLRDTTEKDALDEAMVEAQSRRVGYAGLSPQAQQKLDASPLARAKFDLKVMQGDNLVTTARGTQALLLMPDAELDKIQTEAELYRLFDHEMAPKEMGEMRKRWMALKTGKAAPDAFVTEAVKIAALDAGLLPSATSGKTGLTETENVILLRMLHAVKDVAARGDGVASRADIDAAIKKEFGNVIRAKSSDKPMPVSSYSKTDIKGAWSDVAGGGFVEFPAADDPMRVEALRRIEIRREEAIKAGLPADTLDPERLSTLADELGLMRSEQAAVIRAKINEENARRADYIMQSRDAAQRRFDETYASQMKSLGEFFSAGGRAAERSAPQTKTGTVKAGPDSPGLKAYKEAEAKKMGAKR